MYIRLENPELLGTLLASLVDACCVAEPVDARTCRIEYPDAANDRQAMLELRFFLRAWQRLHGDAELSLLHVAA